MVHIYKYRCTFKQTCYNISQVLREKKTKEDRRILFIHSFYLDLLLLTIFFLFYLHLLFFVYLFFEQLCIFVRVAFKIQPIQQFLEYEGHRQKSKIKRRGGVRSNGHLSEVKKGQSNNDSFLIVTVYVF